MAESRSRQHHFGAGYGVRADVDDALTVSE